MVIRLLPKGIPFVKRFIDLIIALTAMIILSPVLIFISILVLINHGFPILYRQLRPGYRGEIFTIFKFRTMKTHTESNGQPSPDEKRLTKLGSFLRAASLDELPELVNVIKGEMSLVGPRPLLVDYLPLYNAEQSRRHSVLPGITGWAQVNGRNILSWQEKFEMDVWYVDNWTPWLDFKIIAQSIIKVLKREGISQPGYTSAEQFQGNPPEE